jgi:SAM-dependent methyltransferase
MTPSPGPYPQAMLEYSRGDTAVACAIHRDDGYSDLVPVATFFAGPPFNPLEQLALDRSTGRVLDLGAGVGRHSLFLQEQRLQVTALELEPALVAIMAERGVAEPLAASIFSPLGRKFDTVLMLMCGFGLVGTPNGAEDFFGHARHLLAPGGQILCDSLDVRQNTNPAHLAYQEANIRSGRPAGQRRYWMEYRGRRAARSCAETWLVGGDARSGSGWSLSGPDILTAEPRPRGAKSIRL